MHKLRLVLATALAAATLVFGGAAWAATAATQPTVYPVPAVGVIAPVEKATPPAPATPATCEYGADTPVETIAWAEIARLESLGFPVCETVWSFTPELTQGDANVWGLAYPAISAEDPRSLVVLELDELDYAGHDLETAVRTTVRHEYGHIIAFRAGDLGIDHAHETAADAVAEALTPAGEARVWFYDETVTADELASAAAALAPYTAQTL